MKAPIVFRVVVSIVSLLVWGLLQAFLKQNQKPPVPPAVRAEWDASIRKAQLEADEKANAAFRKQFEEHMLQQKKSK